MENFLDNEGGQYHLALKRGDISRYVLLPGDPNRVPMIAAKLSKAREVANRREYCTYTGELDGIPVSVTSTGIGCPSAAIAVEELLRVGADTLIRVGTAGSLQHHVRTGHLVIATGAVREEGTTLQYVPLAYPAVANPDVLLALRQAAVTCGAQAHTGIVHCKDAFYAEVPELTPMAAQNKERWMVWHRAGVLATSMETSAIFILATLRGLRAGEVVAVVGSTIEDTPIVHLAGVDQAIDVALEAVRTLYRQDCQAGA